MTDRILVIGVGNDLRGDDAAGRAVADEIDRLAIPGVGVRSLPQLVPELALDIGTADRVVFVDADIDATDVTERAVSAGGRVSNTHHGDPAALLRLAALDGSPPPTATIVSIPASSFGLGEPLSPATAGAVGRAIELVRSVVEGTSAHEEPLDVVAEQEGRFGA